MDEKLYVVLRNSAGFVFATSEETAKDLKGRLGRESRYETLAEGLPVGVARTMATIANEDRPRRLRTRTKT